MDEIPQVQNAQNAQAENTQSVVQSPKGTGKIREIFSISSWIILFALLPVTVLILLSQNTIPGDLFYPVKRSLENVVLAAASVSPATRAAFRTDLTERRFKEAQGLVVSKSSASGLSAFIDEVQGTKQEVANLKDDTQRIKAEEKFINKLEEYQVGLSTLEAKTEQNVIAYQFQEIPTTAPPPTLTPSPTPEIISALSSPQPSLTPIPTLTMAPTIAPNIQTAPKESARVSEQKKIAQSLKETKEQLDEIKKDLEEKRIEAKEKRDERGENERNDKEDRKNKEKRDSSDREK